MNSKTVIKLNSDNFHDQLITFDAYREIRLQMSTGDFACHTHEVVEVATQTPVITGWTDLGEALLDNGEIL